MDEFGLDMCRGNIGPETRSSIKARLKKKKLLPFFHQFLKHLKERELSDVELASRIGRSATESDQIHTVVCSFPFSLGVMSIIMCV